jgi:hypothetical protein
MKSLFNLLIVSAFFLLAGCLSDKHVGTIFPQKIYESVNAKYPSDKNTLILIDAPEGYIAPHQAVWEVEKDVDAGDVAAIISSLALKTSTVIIAGEDDALTNATLTKALTKGIDKINGAKAIVVGNQKNQKNLADLASASGVTLEFIDNPN